MRIYTKLLMTAIGCLLVSVPAVFGQQKPEPKEKQIAAAVSAAPSAMQPNAAVLGYNEAGELVNLRDGNNKLLCVADNPREKKFHVTCYHKDLEPFMKRGRQLRTKGMPVGKVDSLRREEIKAGTLSMPRKPMALYSLTGPKGSYNYKTNTVNEARPLYVVYIPFATEASTGLSQKPVSKGAPWIMEPGKPWAHIMVMTGRKVGSDADKN